MPPKTISVALPLATRFARAIDLAIGERVEGPLFCGASGRRLDHHGAGRIILRIARAAGITRNVRPHTLRHAFNTAALDASVPLRDVQEAASHADPRNTMRYDRGRQPSTVTSPTSSRPSSPAPPAESRSCSPRPFFALARRFGGCCVRCASVPVISRRASRRLSRSPPRQGLRACRTRQTVPVSSR